VRSRTAPILVAVGASAWGYVTVVRPRQLTWGATAGEVSRRLPGDDLVQRPSFNATRAISIAAPPEAVWPWLVQVGTTRAGWYSYDLLDNLGHPSARRIIPELQRLAPGDVVPMDPAGTKGLAVHSVDRPHSMIWGTPGDTSWLWQLEPGPAGSTRLITRIRSRIRWSPMSIAFAVLIEAADFWMIRKMLVNLRQRAEAVPAVAVPADEASAVVARRCSDRGAGDPLVGR
jgi:hypothetical protein